MLYIKYIKVNKKYVLLYVFLIKILDKVVL
jgi:hypothetical protein